MEIVAIRQTIDQTGRLIAFSATPLAEGENVSTHANMWRISDDFWDKWSLLFDQFARVRNWMPFCGLGHWPDAEYAPDGILQMGKSKTHFTRDEQIINGHGAGLYRISRHPVTI